MVISENKVVMDLSSFLWWVRPLIFVWSLNLQIWFMSADKLLSQNQLPMFPISPWWCYYHLNYFFPLQILGCFWCYFHFLLPLVANYMCQFLPQWRRWLSWSPEVWRCYQAKTTSTRYPCVSHSSLPHFIKGKKITVLHSSHSEYLSINPSNSFYNCFSYNRSEWLFAQTMNHIHTNWNIDWPSWPLRCLQLC